MKQLSLSALAVCLSLGCGAALAEDKPAPKDDGVSLMEEGARLLFRGLMSEMEPAISGMSEALQEMEPGSPPPSGRPSLAEVIRVYREVRPAKLLACLLPR